MTSLLLERLAVRPRLQHLPADVAGSSGREAVELAASAGLVLDPWQCHVLEHGLAERADGRWSALTVGLNVPRQNGKGAVLEARTLAGLFLFGERLVIWTAHEFKTAKEGYGRLLSLIEQTPDLRRKVRRVLRSNESHEIELTTGQRVKFMARNKGAGRGFSADLVILDEAMRLSDDTYGAILPTLSAMPNPQVWLTGSAPLRDSAVWHRIRKLAQLGVAPDLAMFEWSVDRSAYGDDEWRDARTRPEVWAQANPGFPVRPGESAVRNELGSLGDEQFDTERLGLPVLPAEGAGVIDLRSWLALADRASSPERPTAFALDVGPRGAWASIAVGGVRADGRVHVEIADRSQGTAWVVARAVELHGRHGVPLVVQPKHPTAGLLQELAAAGVPLVEVSGVEWERACAAFDAGVRDAQLRHLGEDDPWSPAVADALLGAEVVETDGGLWRWSHGSSACDITPLVALTLAHHAASTTVPAERVDPTLAVW
jgi:hypothetical protein